MAEEVTLPNAGSPQTMEVPDKPEGDALVSFLKGGNETIKTEIRKQFDNIKAVTDKINSGTYDKVPMVVSSLTATTFTGTGTLNGTFIGTSTGTHSGLLFGTISSTAVLDSTVAATSDAQVVNKKFVDDSVSTAGSAFGSYVSGTFGATQTATGDIIVVAYASGSPSNQIWIQAESPAGTIRLRNEAKGIDDPTAVSVTLPVKSGQTYLITKSGDSSNAISFIPVHE